ncbi:hypothetical protein [Ralstonia thomasii]
MLKIELSALKEAVDLAGRVVNARGIIPILSMIRITTDGDKTVRFTGTDTVHSLSVTVDADIQSAFDVCVPADRLRAVAGLSGDRARIKLDEERKKLEVSMGTSRFSMAYVDGADHPAMKIEGDPVAEFDAPGLVDLIGTVSFAVAGNKEHARPYLQNVWVESDGTAIHLVAGDGFRLASNSLPLATQEFGVPISSGTAKQLVQLPVTRFRVFDRYIVAAGDRIQFIASRPSSKYPNWRRVFPKAVHSIKVPKAALAEICPIHRQFGTDGYVRFETEGRECVIQVKGDTDDIEVIVPITASSDEALLNVWLSAALLQQMIDQVSGESVEFMWEENGPQWPRMIQSGSWRGVLAPVKQ